MRRGGGTGAKFSACPVLKSHVSAPGTRSLLERQTWNASNDSNNSAQETIDGAKSYV